MLPTLRDIAATMALGALALGCAPAHPPRSSDRGEWVTDVDDAPAAKAQKEFGPWRRVDELVGFRVIGSPEPSDHAGGGLLGELRVDAGASEYGSLGRRSPMPAGATVTLALRPLGQEDPEVFFVMVKQPPGYDPGGDDWEYLVVLPSGQVENRGPIPLCRRCHAEAPREHLFESWRASPP